MKAIFYSAALFTFLSALATRFFLGETYELFGITPIPAVDDLVVTAFSHMFSSLLFAFAVGYFWIARNPENNIALIKFGILAKMALVTFTLADIMQGVISWQIMIPMSGDIVYSVLFFLALRRLA